MAASLKTILDFDDDKREYFDKWFLKCVKDVDLNSIPGYCVLRNFGSTNRQVFNVDMSGSYDLERLLLIRDLVWDRFEELAESDPIYAFGKPEPHKINKIREGRYRIISAVSLLDSLCDRLLFMPLLTKIKKSITNTPVAVGWSPIFPVPFHHMMGGHHDSYLAIDKSSWDWTVQPWLLDAVKGVLLEMVSAPSWWRSHVSKRFQHLFGNPVWKFQDGVEIVQAEPGIMKSGCYLTIWINSISQLILHHLAVGMLSIEPGKILALGDDTIQVLSPEHDNRYVETLSNMGFTIKSHRTKVPEFCGFHFHKFKFVPAYGPKHQFLLRHLTEDPEEAKQVLQSYQLLYMHDERKLKAIRKLASELGLSDAYVSDQRLRMIVDNA